MESTFVILVDPNDQEIGVMEKMEAHSKGLLHRAFSIFLFNTKGELLLQKRAEEKYHSPGLWTNTCCSHPIPNEPLEDSIHDRLIFEMGIDASMEELFNFTYKSQFENGLTEHEFDHVFVGITNENPKINPKEVSDFKWIHLKELEKEMKLSEQQFTSWFRILMNEHMDKFEVYLENESL